MSNVTALFKAPVQPHTAFDDFWSVYPKKVSKGFARTAWLRAIRKATADTIIEGAMRYAQTAEAPYIKHPATWLNAECWADQEPESPAPLDRLEQLARLWFKPPMTNFKRDWIARNVTPEDTAAMRERGLIE